MAPLLLFFFLLSIASGSSIGGACVNIEGQIKEEEFMTQIFFLQARTLEFPEKERKREKGVCVLLKLSKDSTHKLGRFRVLPLAKRGGGVIEGGI